MTGPNLFVLKVTIVNVLLIIFAKHHFSQSCNYTLYCINYMGSIVNWFPDGVQYCNLLWILYLQYVHFHLSLLNISVFWSLLAQCCMVVLPTLFLLDLWIFSFCSCCLCVNIPVIFWWISVSILVNFIRSQYQNDLMFIVSLNNLPFYSM